MKLVVLAALIAIGCSSKSEPSGGSGRPPRQAVDDPLGFCERARKLIVVRRKCFEEDTSLKMALDSLVELVVNAPDDPAGRRRVGATCAVMLDGMMRASQPANCPLDVLDEERAELVAFLAAWYGERTAAPVTGNADLDAKLAKLAGQRDAGCACKDLTCARKIGDEIDDDLPSNAPQTAVDAKAKMIDEVARCREKLASGR